MFIFGCHIEVVTVYSSLQRRCLTDCALMVTSACVITAIIYNVVAVFVVLTFGPLSKQNFLMKYYPIDWSLTIGMILMALKCALSYLTIFFCLRVMISNALSNTTNGTHSFGEGRQRIVVAVSIFVITLLIALFVPNIGIVIKITGGSVTSLVFVFPGLCLALHATSLPFNQKCILRCLGIM